MGENFPHSSNRTKINFLLAFFLLFAVPNTAVATSTQIAQPALIYSTSTAEAIIRSYAAVYGVSGDELYNVAKCESSLNSRAFNAQDPNGGSKGVFQFQNSTFAKFAPEAGIVNPNVWNPLDSIQTAAYMFSIGEQHRWSCYTKIYGKRV